MADSTQITSLIIRELASGEKGALSLVVAVRRMLGRSENIKGDLSHTVKCALRQLVASEAVVDMDGLFSLSPPKRGLGTFGATAAT